MNKYKIKDLNERLDKESNQDHKNKMLYMWIKQDHISLSEYNELVKNHGVSHHVSQRSELLAFKDWFNNLPDESDDRLYITDETIDRFKANCA